MDKSAEVLRVYKRASRVFTSFERFVFRRTYKMTSRHPISYLAMLALSLCAVHVGGTRHLGSQNLNPGIYCGRNLAKVLALICYEESFEKRSDVGGRMYNAIPIYYKEKDQDTSETQLGWPWLNTHKSLSLNPASRGKRYVVSECCDKACSVEELLSYC